MSGEVSIPHVITSAESRVVMPLVLEWPNYISMHHHVSHESPNLEHCCAVQAKARLLAANKKAAGAKKAVASAALAEAKARKAKLSKQKDTRNFNQVCDAMAIVLPSWGKCFAGQLRMGE